MDKKTREDNIRFRLGREWDDRKAAGQTVNIPRQVFIDCIRHYRAMPDNERMRNEQIRTPERTLEFDVLHDKPKYPASSEMPKEKEDRKKIDLSSSKLKED